MAEKKTIFDMRVWNYNTNYNTNTRFGILELRNRVTYYGVRNRVINSDTTQPAITFKVNNRNTRTRCEYVLSYC